MEEFIKCKKMWTNSEKSEYTGDMGAMGLILILEVNVLILLFGVSGLYLGR